MVDLSVIIVNWNSKDYVRQCLTSLFAHSRATPMEVIVADGGSFDGCGEMLAKEFPSVRFIQIDKNVGFGRANNEAVRQSKGRYLMLLNPDTVLHEDTVGIMVARLKSLPQAGAVGCKHLNPDRSLQATCIQSFPTVLNQLLDSDFLRTRLPNSPLWGTAPLWTGSNQPAEIEAMSGACIFLKREVFEKVGGFTESYFMYGEDMDLCLKIKRAGFRNYYVPETSIMHYGGGCTKDEVSGFSTVMMRESIYKFLRLNYGLPRALAYRAVMAVSSTIRLMAIVILLPVSRNRVVRHGTGSLKKWLAVLRWGVGMESWVRTYPEAA